ncbi:MAG: aldehyde dehydrogenase family protein [Dehalococcoidia bacterium]
MAELTSIPEGMQLLYGGNKLAAVPEDVRAAFRAGDRLAVVQRSGDVLHIPAAQWDLAEEAVARASAAFQELAATPDENVTCFFERFAARLADDDAWAQIAAQNEMDVSSATSRGRSTTRLKVSDGMRRDMIDGLRGWAQMAPPNGPRGSVEHEGWRIDELRSGYGVVGFVFEGRPNVLADGVGVLRSGNTAVMRIGSDALGTARSIVELALRPAVKESGLPEGAVVLLDSAAHAAGWAMFSNPLLGLAIARGSGPAVLTLGSLATQAGIPVSMHGTGGAWIVADETASAADLRAAVFHSVDRKVCNSLNVLCLPRSRAAELAAEAIAALEERGALLGHGYKLHVVEGSEACVPTELFNETARMLRAEGEVEEPIAETLPADELGREWEWEGTPEVSLVVVEDSVEGARLFNSYAPRFIASLISEDPEVHERFFHMVDAPFVGNGFTRWVDGQYALRRPELGLSNWQYGRLLGRSGILSGDSIYSVRLRATQDRPDIHR